MTQLFRNLVEYHIEETGNAKRKLEAFVNKTYPSKMRELLMTEATGAELIHTEFNATVLEGANYATFARNVCPIVPMGSASYEWPVTDAAGIASFTPEGAPANLTNRSYNHVSFSAHKVSEIPLITDEMIQDGAYGVIEIETRAVGARIENKLNQYTLDTLLEGASLEHDTAGSDQGQKALIKGRALAELVNFFPNRMILHPTFEENLLLEVSLTNYTTSPELLAKGAVGKLSSMDAFVSNVPSASSTYTWGYSNDGEIGALLFDSMTPAAVIMMREDMSVKPFEDVLKGITGSKVTSRFDAGVLRGNGIVRIEY